MQITQPKPKKKAKFRISFIVLFFLASIVICFFSYMKSESDFTFFETFSKGKTTESGGNVSAVEIVTDKSGSPLSGGIVAESNPKDLSYFDNTMFIGASELSSLSGFAWVKPDRVLSDNAVTSSNIGNVVVRFNGTNQTPSEAVLSVQPSALYLLFRPEESLNTESLKAFIDGVSDNLKSTKIYIISAFPPTENSGTTITETDTFNAALLSFAEENSLKYVDINLSVTDNAGRLRSDFVSGNGISGTGAEFFAKYLLSHT